MRTCYARPANYARRKQCRLSYHPRCEYGEDERPGVATERHYEWSDKQQVGNTSVFGMPVVDEKIAYSADSQFITARMRGIILDKTQIVAIKRCYPVDDNETNVDKQNSGLMAEGDATRWV